MFAGVVLGFFISIAEPEFLAISFDASGSTTGILAVPFILSLSVGIPALKKDSKSSEKDSFGLVAIASIGAIISKYPLLSSVFLKKYRCYFSQLLIGFVIAYYAVEIK